MSSIHHHHYRISTYRNDTDSERVHLLAELRVAYREIRLEIGIPYEEQEEADTVPEKGF